MAKKKPTDPTKPHAPRTWKTAAGHYGDCRESNQKPDQVCLLCEKRRDDEIHQIG